MSGSVVVHAGPSIPRAVRERWGDLDWRPPAVAGDGLRVERAGVSTFVLVDGLFDAECAIRHNELLRLLAAGVRVIGAASMGALRAAELHPFGMEGVGRVFQAYRDGRLVGDDEVALLHGPAELDWLAVTTPLVNVRATLLHACRTRRLSPAQARQILGAAQALPFSERTWPALCADLPRGARTQTLSWLETHVQDVKRQDALSALRAAARDPACAPISAGWPPHTIFSQALDRLVAAGG